MANNPFDPMAPMSTAVSQNQRMADVMRMQSLQPIQNVGASPLSRVSPVQGLAQMLSAHVGNRYQDKANETQSAMVQAMQELTNQGLEQYMAEYQEDPRGAVMRAMSSPSPVLRAMATQELKGLMTPKSMAAHATDASVIGSNGNAAQFQAKRDLKTVEPGKPLMDEQGQIVVPTIQPGAGQTLETINGDLYGRTPTGVDQINKAPRVTTNTTVNNNTPLGETEFEKAFGRKEGARLSDDLQQRSGKVEGVSAAQEGLKLLDEGIHAGLFADMKKNLDKGYGLIASKEPEKAARTERFIAHIGNLVIPRLKDFGGSDTVEEMKYLQRVMGGDNTLEVSALRQILTSVEQKLQKRVEETDKTVEAYRDRGNTLPTIDRGVQQPVDPTKVPTLEEHLKSLGL